MLHLFRRSAHPPSASTSSTPPAIVEPPPPASARREKERGWLSSIGAGPGRGKERGKPPPSSSAGQGKGKGKDPTLTLATRLQELAVAHADGLLDEEAYRALRGQAFEASTAVPGGAGEGEVEVLGVGGRAEGGLKVPRLAGVEAGGQRRSSLTPSASTSSPPPSHLPSSPPLPQTQPQPARAPSVLSSQSRRASVLNLFRKSSVAAPSPSASPSIRSAHSRSPEDDATSVFSGRSGYTAANGHSSRTANRSEPFASPRSPALSSAVSSPVLRTRSIRAHPGMASSALDVRGSVGVGGGGESVLSASTEGSYSAGGRRGSTLASPPSTRRTRNGLSTYGSAYSHSSHSSSRLETLSSFSHSSPPSRHAAPLPPLVSTTDPLLFAASGAEPTALELRQEIEEIERERERVEEGWRELVRGAVGKWEREVGREVVERLGGLVAVPSAARPSPKEPTARRRSVNLLASPSPHLPPPSSSPPLLLPPFLHSPPLSSPPIDLPDDLSLLTSSLIADVDGIRARERETSEKYDRRREFLEAKLRGAELRERLGRGK
ncbi:hypothetical protein JCM8097_001138 [Rhodosporidiobolus ruineniae]